jgi:hypothetical protein
LFDLALNFRGADRCERQGRLAIGLAQGAASRAVGGEARVHFRLPIGFDGEIALGGRNFDRVLADGRG